MKAEKTGETAGSTRTNGAEADRKGDGRRRLWAGTFLVLIVAALLFLRGRQPLERHHTVARSGVSMNTTIHISATGGDKRELEDVLGEAFSLLDNLNGQLSLFQEGSALSRINEAAGVEPIRVSPDVFSVIEDAREACALTDGAFNPLVGPLTKLWRINRQTPPEAESTDLHARMRFRLPDAASIDALLPLTRTENLEMYGPDRVYLRQKGCMLDLGGIAKGYASLRLADLFREHGIASALLDLGGNIYAVGAQPDGAPWRIGIRNPLESGGAPIAILSAADTAVVTSGTYERFKIIDGVRYSHFFDPTTGYPVRNALLSATVVTPDGTLADALATAFMVMGPERSTKFLKDRPELGAILILNEGEDESDPKGLVVLASRNLEGRLRMRDPSTPLQFF